MSEITIIGGITADIEGRPYQRLLHGESNPGKISMSYGGAGRNIAENLGRIGASVSFHSVVGDDFTGRGAVRELKDLGVDVSGVRLLPGENTAVYMSILDIVGDLELALCNMDAMERISADFIDRVADSAGESDIIALDTNLQEDALAYAAARFCGKPLFLDPVSALKAERAKSIIGKFHTIKPNRTEAEVLSGIEIRDPEALDAAGKWFLDAGVKQVFITLSAGGVYYRNNRTKGIMESLHKHGEIVSAAGAGDAFSAAILYGFTRGFAIEETAVYGSAAASVAMEAKAAVNPLMSIEEIERRFR